MHPKRYIIDVIPYKAWSAAYESQCADGQASRILPTSFIWQYSDSSNRCEYAEAELLTPPRPL